MPPLFDYSCDAGHPRWNVSYIRPVEQRNRKPRCPHCGKKMKRVIQPAVFGNAKVVADEREK